MLVPKRRKGGFHVSLINKRYNQRPRSIFGIISHEESSCYRTLTKINGGRLEARNRRTPPGTRRLTLLIR